MGGIILVLLFHDGVAGNGHKIGDVNVFTLSVNRTDTELSAVNTGHFPAGQASHILPYHLQVVEGGSAIFLRLREEVTHSTASRSLEK